jgi:hypothetical protein
VQPCVQPELVAVLQPLSNAVLHWLSEKLAVKIGEKHCQRELPKGIKKLQLAEADAATHERRARSRTESLGFHTKSRCQPARTMHVKNTTQKGHTHHVLKFIVYATMRDADGSGEQLECRNELDNYRSRHLLRLAPGSSWRSESAQ